MEKIIKYRTTDNKEFNDEDKCIKHEELLVLCDKARELVPRPDNWNSRVGLQNNEDNLIEFDRQFKQILIEHTNPDIVNLWDNDRKGIIGRYLCDGYDTIYSLYVGSVLCVGSDRKSYGQPAFTR